VVLSKTLDYVGTVYYRVQHVDGTDDDWLQWADGDWTNPYGQVMDDASDGTDYSFMIVDDDLVAPAFANDTFSGLKLHVDITDDSGIYDPGSGGERIYMRYDDDGEVDTDYDGEIDLSPYSGNTYDTDSDISYGSTTGETVTFRVYVYDNDSDGRRNLLLLG
jgi:hypothetical protein